jgi:prefoldin subunit 5
LEQELGEVIGKKEELQKEMEELQADLEALMEEMWVLT